jgi:hypothetical protein
VLRSGAFDIDLIYRRISAQEFLLRFTLNHPLVQAYRDHKVCIVNSFRSELSHKKAMFALLTDETLTAKFPILERKAIREHVPWTRVVKAGKTTGKDEPIEDLLQYIKQNREKLVLRPNDEYSDLHSYIGYEHDEGSWARAHPRSRAFALCGSGAREARADGVPADELRASGIQGNAGGCAAAGIPRQSFGLFQLRVVLGRGQYSLASGIAPTFIIDTKA